MHQNPSDVLISGVHVYLRSMQMVFESFWCCYLIGVIMRTQTQIINMSHGQRFRTVLHWRHRTQTAMVP